MIPGISVRQVPFVEPQMTQRALYMFQHTMNEKWCKKRFTDKLDTDILVSHNMRSLLPGSIFQEYATPKVTLMSLYF